MRRKNSSYDYFTNLAFQLLMNDQLDLLFTIFHIIWAIYIIMRSCYFCAEANKKHIILSVFLVLFASEFLNEIFNINFHSFNNFTSIISKIILKIALTSLSIYVSDISEDVYIVIHKYLSNLLALIHGILQFRIFIIVSQKYNYVIGAAISLSDTLAELFTRKLVRGRAESPLTGMKSVFRTSLIIVSFVILEYFYNNKYYKHIVILSSISLGIINFFSSFL